MSGTINVGLSVSILVLFLIIIGIGYIYINEGRRSIETMNTTLTKFIGAWNDKQVIDNARFNVTFVKLDRGYTQAISNQKIMLGVLNQTQINGNLTLALIGKAVTDTNKTLSNQEGFKIFTANTTKDLGTILMLLNHTR